jgi:DNA processing protein
MESSITTINNSDPDFPIELKSIPQPPKILYTQGWTKKGETRIAVVGTRLCSPYGKQAVLSIVQGLVDAGITIVSGLTPGIDTLAHQTAVENKARTIAVLGTGLDKRSIYPQTNVVLADKIVENGGLLISEYPPGTHGMKFSFPQRNRIISGLSLAVLVIEAKEKSGSLITAEWARKQGKTVFAVPGSIYTANSRGCHYLIKRGAKLVENASDILDELKIKSQTEAKTLNLFGDNAEESKILESLKEGALETDKIIIKTGLPAKSVLSTLPVLEIKGKIKDLGNNIYALGNR